MLEGKPLTSEQSAMMAEWLDVARDAAGPWIGHPDDPSDEAIMGMYQALYEHVTKGGGPPEHLGRLVKCRIFDAFRKYIRHGRSRRPRKGRPAAFTDALPLGFDGPAPPDPTPDDGGPLVERLLGSLTPRQAAIARGHALEGLTLAAAARAAGVSKSRGHHVYHGDAVPALRAHPAAIKWYKAFYG